MGTEAPSTFILDDLNVPHETGAALAPLTWYGVGGSAAVLVKPRSTEQLQAVVRRCHETATVLRVLGKGANLLVGDGVIGGVVVSLDSPAFKRVDIDPSGTVVCGGGADLEKVITSTVRAGLGGLEVLAGIPATIGGAMRMNAGGAFGEIGPSVQRVTVMERDGTMTALSRERLEFSYRRSNIGERIVLEVEFALKPVEDQAALRERLKEVMKYKKNSQPMAFRSAGCAFKNPPKAISERGAGKLIDDAGLKGLRIGGAEVSPVHANFIVLHPGGSASDVLAVMEHVEREVAAKHGIKLEREVVVWQG